MKNKKLLCEECGESFSTKKVLVEHLRREFERVADSLDCVVGQLDHLGIKNLYKKKKGGAK